MSTHKRNWCNKIFMVISKIFSQKVRSYQAINFSMRSNTECINRTDICQLNLTSQNIYRQHIILLAFSESPIYLCNLFNHFDI